MRSPQAEGAGEFHGVAGGMGHFEGDILLAGVRRGEQLQRGHWGMGHVQGGAGHCHVQGGAEFQRGHRKLGHGPPRQHDRNVRRGLGAKCGATADTARALQVRWRCGLSGGHYRLEPLHPLLASRRSHCPHVRQRHLMVERLHPQPVAAKRSRAAFCVDPKVPAVCRRNRLSTCCILCRWQLCRWRPGAKRDGVRDWRVRRRRHLHQRPPMPHLSPCHRLSRCQHVQRHHGRVQRPSFQGRRDPLHRRRQRHHQRLVRWRGHLHPPAQMRGRHLFRRNRLPRRLQLQPPEWDLLFAAAHPGRHVLC